MKWPDQLFLVGPNGPEEVNLPALQAAAGSEVGEREAVDRAAAFTAEVGSIELNERPRRIEHMLLDLLRLGDELRERRAASRRGAIALHWLMQNQTYKLLVDANQRPVFKTAKEFEQAFAAKVGLPDSLSQLSTTRRAAGLMLKLEQSLQTEQLSPGRVAPLVVLPEETATAICLAMTAQSPEGRLPSSVVLQAVARKLRHEGDSIPTEDVDAQRRRVIYEAILALDEVQGLLGREHLTPSEQAEEPPAVLAGLDRLEQTLKGEDENAGELAAPIVAGPFVLSQDQAVLTLELNGQADAALAAGVGALLQQQGWKAAEAGAAAGVWHYHATRVNQALRRQQLGPVLARARYLVELLAGAPRAAGN